MNSFGNWRFTLLPLVIYFPILQTRLLKLSQNRNKHHHEQYLIYIKIYLKPRNGYEKSSIRTLELNSIQRKIIWAQLQFMTKSELQLDSPEKVMTQTRLMNVYESRIFIPHTQNPATRTW